MILTFILMKSIYLLLEMTFWLFSLSSRCLLHRPFFCIDKNLAFFLFNMWWSLWSIILVCIISRWLFLNSIFHHFNFVKVFLSVCLYNILKIVLIFFFQWFMILLLNKFIFAIKINLEDDKRVKNHLDDSTKNELKCLCLNKIKNIDTFMMKYTSLKISPKRFNPTSKKLNPWVHFFL